MPLTVPQVKVAVRGKLRKTQPFAGETWAGVAGVGMTTKVRGGSKVSGGSVVKTVTVTWRVAVFDPQRAVSV